jgi:hypothetical protein
MPITFDCPECGKACRAPAEMAGRKAKCQECKAIITVPAEEEQVADKPLPKRKAVPAVADDEDEEKPRAKKSRKDDEDEEKPRAKKSRRDDDDEEDKPRKKKGRKDDDDDDDDSPRVKKSRKDDDEDEDDDDSPSGKKKRKYHDVDDSPRKKTKAKGKKSGSGMGTILMLGGAALALVVLCGGGGALAWWLWFSTASEMAFAPDGCTYVEMVHVSQIESSGAYQTLTKDNPQAKKQFTAPGNNDAITQAGMESMFTAGSDNGEVIVIKTKKSISQADLSKGKNLKETKAGKYTLLEGTGEALCLADSSTVVFSHKPDLLKKVLERGKAPELSDNMKKALKYTDLSKSMAFASDHKGGVKRAAGGLAAMGGAPVTGNEVECSGGYQQVDSDIRVSYTYLFKDGPSAEAAKKKQDENMELTKKLAGGKGNTDNPMLEVAQAIQVSVSGSELRMEGTIKADLIARLMKQFGGGGGPGGGGKPPRGFVCFFANGCPAVS